MKLLGLLGGMSWESTAIYYRLMNIRAKERHGTLHSARLLLYSFNFEEIAALQRKGDWATAAERMIAAGQLLKQGGAEAIVICTNTMHKLAADIEQATGLPVLHIIDATAAALQEAGITRAGLLGTQFTMEQDFYRTRFAERFGIELITPDAASRERVHRIIFDELCQGIIRDESRMAYRRIIDELQRQGAEGIILGCTEIGMLIGPEDGMDLPLFDTTRLHADYAMDYAMGKV